MAKRESPTYVNLGLDKEILVRLERPLKQEAEKLYEAVYRTLPKAGMGRFLGFAVSLGIDQIRREYGVCHKKSPARGQSPVPRRQK